MEMKTATAEAIVLETEVATTMAMLIRKMVSFNNS